MGKQVHLYSVDGSVHWNNSYRGNLTIFIKVTNGTILFNLEISLPGFCLSHKFAYIK